MNNSHLAEIEDDIQQQLARTEEKVRDEVSRIPAGFFVDCCPCDSLKLFNLSLTLSDQMNRLCFMYLINQCTENWTKIINYIHVKVKIT